MTQKGLEVLTSIIHNGYIELVDKIVIGRDANIQNDAAEEIETLCKKNKISYCYRTTAIESSSSYAIAVSWRWMIKLDNSCKLIVLHDSLLPKYRGFAPLVNQLIKGENTVGVTALLASEEYDKGNIIGQESIEVKYPIKIQEAIELISPLYAMLVNKILQEIKTGKEISGLPQKEEEASYSLWRDDFDYRIDWNEDAAEIVRFIHAVGYPYTGAQTLLNGNPVRVADAEEVPDVDIEIRQPGKVIFNIDQFPVIVCGKGLLKITAMQDQNGNSVLPLQKFRSRFT
ncbi:MAG TPA: formyltransferase family protein [Niabella sp.]|nr:formyltransferase family protein [Niabella sp.]